MNEQPENPQSVVVIRQASPETEGAATTSLWLEIIFGLFSLLGLGHVYSGRTLLGIGLMLGWWVYIIVAGFLSAITAGFGLCLFIPIYIAVPIFSGIQARTYVHKTGGKGNWKNVALVGGGGCLVIILVAVGILLLVGIFTVVRQSGR
jgi:hypothetical protein